MKQSKYFILSVLLLLSPITFADYQTLVHSLHRPTMADIDREMPEKKLSNSPTFDTHTKLLNVTARLIAELEWAYPGAIYMPLGRDVVLTGDIIDAFYRSQGQPNRVIRLNASGQSLNVSDDMIARFVETSIGKKIKNLTKGPSYIFFDASNYSLPRNSQSTTILTAVYSKYVQQGGKAEDLLTQFAFFNLSKSRSSAVPVYANINKEEILLQQKQYLKENPTTIPNRVFTASEGARGSSEWHDSFGGLTEMVDGSVIAPIGQAYELERREAALNIMLAIRAGVKKPEFIKLVQDRAYELGYQFEVKQNCDEALR